MNNVRMLRTSQTASALFMALGLGLAHAATFTYHGSLQDSGKPAEGSYDIELTLYSAPSGGSVIGGPLVMYKVPVHNGSFNTEADFGPLTKSFGQAYVAVGVRNAGKGDFAALETRAAVSSETASVCPGAWTLQGNAGNPAGSYLGTADTQPLTFEVNGVQAGQITASGDNTAASGAANVVFGYSGNSVSAGTGAATISGGGSPLAICGTGRTSPCINSVQASFATVGGGLYNTAAGGGTVGGGEGNSAIGADSTVAGGSDNIASGQDSTVAGGSVNIASGFWSAIGGGQENQASEDFASVGGGESNQATGARSTVSGGNSNIASGNNAMVPGGTGNTAGGDLSFAGGSNAVVRDSTQTGNKASCTFGNCGDANTFIWNGNYPNVLTSTGPNQFLIQASGGVAINGTPQHATDELTVYGNGNGGTNNADIKLYPLGATQGIGLVAIGGSGKTATFHIDQTVGTTPTTRFAIGPLGNIGLLGGGTTMNPFTVGTDATNGDGAFLSPGGVWTAGSSRTFKEDFAQIDVGNILAKVIELPVQTWFYKNDHQEGRHMGPVAEDFAALFGLGMDDKHIGGVDESGVAFAAIQGLNQKVEAENAVLKNENADLRDKLNDVLTRLSKLENKPGE